MKGVFHWLLMFIFVVACVRAGLMIMMMFNP